MNGGFVVVPNPPIAGQPAEITYQGSAPEIWWWVDDGTRHQVSVPPKTFTIKVPAGSELILTDREGLQAYVPIEDLGT